MTSDLAQPNPEHSWRAIVLLGANSATYKFALGQVLLSAAQRQQTRLTLEDLALPFSEAICVHLQNAPRQVTRGQSRFLSAAGDYNQGRISRDDLVAATVRYGFANVIDAFHVVSRAEVHTRFFQDDRQSGGGIVLTDHLFALSEAATANALPHELEARWRLVETAWELRVAPDLLYVHHDEATSELSIAGGASVRKSVTSARNALSGYQQGRCFYCEGPLRIDRKEAHVDHVFPIILGSADPAMRSMNLNGVWNLVLACPSCNLSKSARFPDVRWVELLDRRNNHLIESHHPLRETLLRQIGTTPQQRQRWIARVREEARRVMPIEGWRPK